MKQVPTSLLTDRRTPCANPPRRSLQMLCVSKAVALTQYARQVPHNDISGWSLTLSLVGLPPPGAASNQRVCSSPGCLRSPVLPLTVSKLHTSSTAPGPPVAACSTSTRPRSAFLRSGFLSSSGSSPSPLPPCAGLTRNAGLGVVRQKVCHKPFALPGRHRHPPPGLLKGFSCGAGSVSRWGSNGRG